MGGVKMLASPSYSTFEPLYPCMLPLPTLVVPPSMNCGHFSLYSSVASCASSYDPGRGLTVSRMLYRPYFLAAWLILCRSSSLYSLLKDAMINLAEMVETDALTILAQV